jgi:PEP-CTERM motif
MRNRLKQLCGTVALAVAVMGQAGRADAAAIVYVTPTPVVVEVGDVFSIDVFVDADDPVGGFDMDVAWDSTILTFVSADVPSAEFAGNNWFFQLGPGNDVVTSGDFGNPLGANANGLAFKIFSLGLTATALGISAIEIPYVDLSNELGTDLLDRVVQGGVVCVVADKTAFNRADCVVPVPEPGLMALLATGLATAAMRRRRTRG